MLFSGKDLKKLLWPLAVEQFLLVLVGMADIMMVAAAGENAVSGIALVDVLNLLLINIFSALAAGGAVVAGQYLGREDRQNACVAAKQLFYVTTGLSLLLCAGSLLFNEPILRGIYPGLNPEVEENARTYFYLTALSYPAMGVYNCGAALFRAMGNSRVSMLCSLVMNLLNIGGNALLIYGCGWGVAGAGTATLVSRMAAAVIILGLICRKGQSLYLAHPLRFEWRGRMVKNILRIGVPGGLENSMFQIGKLLVAGIIAGFGASAIAADAISNNLAALGNIPGNAIGLGMVTVISRCIGAGDKEGAMRYTKKLLRYNYWAVLCIDAGLLLFAPWLTGLFPLSAEGAALSALTLRIYAAAALLVWPLAWALPCSLRAAGDARFTMLTSLISMWLFRVFLSYLFCGFGWGLAGVWLAMDIDWVVRALVFVLRFRSKKWLKQKVLS